MKCLSYELQTSIPTRTLVLRTHPRLRRQPGFGPRLLGFRPPKIDRTDTMSGRTGRTLCGYRSLRPLVVKITNHGRTSGDVLGGFYGFIRNTAAAGPELKHVFGGGRLSRLFVLPTAMTLGRSR